MALPLYSGQRLGGVFEVFSARPYAFSEQTLSLLREACDLVVEIVAGMLPHLDAAAELHPGRATVPSDRAEASQQQPSLTEPAMQVSPPPGETVEARPSLKTAALSANIRCDVCGYSNPRGQRICGHCDVPLSVVENYLGTPNGEQVREVEAAALLARSRYGLGESLAADSLPARAEESKRDLRPLAGVAALVVLVSLGIGIWKGSHSKAVSSPPQQSPATVSSQSAASSQAPSATPHPAASEAQATAEPSASKHVAAPKTAKAAPKTSNAPLQDAASVRWILKGTTSSKGAVVPVEPAPLPAGSSQLPRLPYIEVVPEAPQIEAPAGAVANKSAPATTAVTGGTLIRKVAPEYPELARSIGKTGTVVLSGTVDRQGTLKNLHAIEGDPILVTAAIQAAQKWRYEPYRLNGNPIEVETKIVFNFRR
jgi:TonB family protein